MSASTKSNTVGAVRTIARRPNRPNPLDLIAEIQRLISHPPVRVPPPVAHPSMMDLPLKVTAEQAKLFRKEYEAGTSLYQLALNHELAASTVRASIKAVGGDIRGLGRAKGMTSPGYERLNKLSDELRTYVLTADDDGIRHSVIGKHVGVTKERVRQICNAAGHPTRRERLAQRRGQAILLRMADGEGRRAIARTMSDEAKKAAELWNAGHEMPVLAQKLNRTLGSMAVCVSRWRALWPSKFPYRADR